MVSLYNLLKQVGYLGLGVFQSIESGRFGDVFRAFPARSCGLRKQFGSPNPGVSPETLNRKGAKFGCFFQSISV